MKKLFTLSLGVALCATVNAESLRVLTLGLGIPGLDEPQLMGLSISADGKYVCGSIEMGNGYFVADIENDVYQFDVTDDDEGAELRHVDNNGLAIGYNGPGVTYSIDGVTTVLPCPPGDYKYVLGEALTNDGSIMVGSIVAPGYVTHAAYSKDGGSWEFLPEVPEEIAGEYYGNGSSAKYISGDGKVILGYIGSFGAGIMWTMNDAGEYELDPLFSKYLVLTEEDEANPEKVLYGLSPMGLSNDGKYALFQGRLVDEDGPYNVPVVYDTENSELTIYPERQEIDFYGLGLMPSAIDNNGTIIGVVGIPMYTSSGTFILKPGESQAVSLGEAFPSYEEMFGMSDMMGYSTPTGMSADGRYIVGYGFYSEDYEDEMAPAYMATFVIDTQDQGTGIQAPESDSVQAVPEAVYTIDGKRLDSMVKGLNIIRMSDGSVRKVFK